MRHFTLLTAVLLIALAGDTLTTSAKTPSRSVGDVTHGLLQHASRLPKKGPGLRVLPKTVSRGFVYGTDELVAAIQRSAAAVHGSAPGSVLGVGNLSRKRGGDIPQSRSHNAGRDADLAFYARQSDGTPLVPSRLVPMEPTLIDRSGKLSFDVAQNWSLVESLVSDPTIAVQWLFCASWVREALLEYAEERGAAARLVARAATALKQPSDSSPHNDHLHLRIYCSGDDRLDSECTDLGAIWPWVPTPAALGERVDSLVATALNASRRMSARLDAIDALTRLRYRAAVAPLLGLMNAPKLRPAVISLVTSTRALEAVPTIVSILNETHHAGELQALRAKVAQLEEQAAAEIS